MAQTATAQRTGTVVQVIGGGFLVFLTFTLTVIARVFTARFALKR